MKKFFFLLMPMVSAFAQTENVQGKWEITNQEVFYSDFDNNGNGDPNVNKILSLVVALKGKEVGPKYLTIASEKMLLENEKGEILSETLIAKADQATNGYVITSGNGVKLNIDVQDNSNIKLYKTGNENKALILRKM